MEIWPSQDMTAEEKVNAISRLVIIFSNYRFFY